MSKPVLYGVSNSRAFRSLWALQELGIDYEHIPTSFEQESKQPEFLAINPNGRIPALKDGSLTLFEAMAINLYLFKQYGGARYPQNTPAEAKLWQWTIWAMTELEPLQMDIAQRKYFTPPELQDKTAIDAACQAMDTPLGVLDGVLARQQWLLGPDFAFADLNVAAVLDALNILDVDYGHFEHLKTWANACYARPSYGQAKSL